MINAKLFKALGIINLTQITNWKLAKDDSKWINAVLIDSKYPSVGNHFAFGFNTKDPHNTINFSFRLSDGKGGPIEFETSEKEVAALCFKIQIIK